MTLSLPLNQALSCWHASTLHFDCLPGELEIQRTNCVQPTITQAPEGVQFSGSYSQGCFRISEAHTRRRGATRKTGKIVVEVPFTKEIMVGNIHGNHPVKIKGDQNLRLRIVGDNDVTIDTVDSLYVIVTGKGNLTVRRVKGYLDCSNRGAGSCTIGKAEHNVIATSSGSGTIMVQSGDSLLVELRSLGTGEVRHMGQAAGASLVKAAGEGTVWLQTALRACHVKASDRGRAGVGVVHGLALLQGEGIHPVVLEEARGKVNEAGNTKVLKRV